ncbi:MAG: hypothetical protein JST35_04820 [Armatimonadetes bacterium]|nr:hypothetical protein [Armatimonadota bacterium]
MLNTRALCGALLIAVTASSFAQPSVVGNWTGKISADLSKMPAPKNAEQKQQMEMAKQMLAKARLMLNLKGDKTFTVKGSGMPGGQNMDASGTYVVKGTKVILTTKITNGKPSKQSTPLTLEMKGGKLVSSQNQGPMNISIVFSK